jgi:putative ABC transport system ATP-binding protein
MSGAVDTEAVVELRGAVKTYVMGRQQVHALNDVSLQFERGAFWAVLGSSGSGKSTLLNILGCLDRLTTGEYRIEGRDVSGLDDDQLSERRLRHIGFIFQSFNLIPQLTVQRNIELPLYYLGWDSEKSLERAMELGRRVGLETRLKHRPTELSGGQMQRVAIARALANDPHLLLADEPTGNLDSATGNQIMALLADLHREGKTIVMVTHEEHLAAYAQKRLYMKDGRIDRIETS